MKLSGQTAVITGGGAGIGRAMALRFAAEGARIVIAELVRERGEEVAEQVRKLGREALVVETDVARAEDCERLFAELDQRDWPVDILVCNAGNVVGGLRPLEEVTDEIWNATVDVHLGGTYRCCRAAVRRMKPRGRGNIITLGSVAGLRGLPGSAPYTAAKGAIIAFTKGLSHEVAPHGIRVNCIAPGWIDTEMLAQLPEKWRPGMLQNTPLGRLGTAEEVAGVALFFASDDSAYVTGQVISPNGGMYR
ncbi:MAG: SDR family oxidoreductase [Pirellulales bacterium]|nr:SDR family oxidoreductase [Pirellulales bacterium]